MKSHYYHRQSGFIGPLLAAIALGMLAWSTAMPGVAAWVMASIAGLHGLLTACFWRLETEVRDGRLLVRFGPLGVFSTRRELRGATALAGRSDWLDGWGIHRVPGRSTIWNLHGFDCVEITFPDGKKLRVGTDDPNGLANAITANQQP